MRSELTKFDYLLNAVEFAAQADNPATQGYAAKRAELFAYVRKLEADSALLDVAAKHYVGADFVYPQHEHQSCLILALPPVRVGADLRASLRAVADLPSSRVGSDET